MLGVFKMTKQKQIENRVMKLLDDIDTEFFSLEDDSDKVAWMRGFRFAMKWRSSV